MSATAHTRRPRPRTTRRLVVQDRLLHATFHAHLRPRLGRGVFAEECDRRSCPSSSGRRITSSRPVGLGHPVGHGHGSGPTTSWVAGSDQAQPSAIRPRRSDGLEVPALGRSSAKNSPAANSTTSSPGLTSATSLACSLRSADLALAAQQTVGVDPRGGAMFVPGARGAARTAAGRGRVNTSPKGRAVRGPVARAHARRFGRRPPPTAPDASTLPPSPALSRASR